MTSYALRMSLLTAVAATVSLPLAYAQNPSTLRVKIPFDFIARGRGFPAGNYVLTRNNSGSLSLADQDGATLMVLPVITSIARSSAADDHLLAFDKVGRNRYLSEVWLPGREGAVVFMQKGEHEHEVIRLVAPPLLSRTARP